MVGEIPEASGAPGAAIHDKYSPAMGLFLKGMNTILGRQVQITFVMSQGFTKLTIGQLREDASNEISEPFHHKRFE